MRVWRVDPDERSPLSAIGTALAVLVHGNVVISAAATSVAATATVLVGRALDPVALFVVFSATFLVYGVNRVTDVEEDERNVPSRAAFTRRYGRASLALGIALYAIAAGAAVARGIPEAGLLVLPVSVAILYSLARVKRLLFVKNLFVGVAWGAIPIGVGVYYDVLRTVEIGFFAVFVTVMLTVAAAIFDIKDVDGDRAAGIRTVPIAFGVRATRIAAAAVTVAVATVVLALVAVGVLPRNFLVLLGFLGYVLAYVPFATPDRGPLFYGLVVDGEHLVLAVLALTLAA